VETLNASPFPATEAVLEYGHSMSEHDRPILLLELCPYAPMDDDLPNGVVKTRGDFIGEFFHGQALPQA
jgi:hypothetical protein